MCFEWLGEHFSLLLDEYGIRRRNDEKQYSWSVQKGLVAGEDRAARSWVSLAGASVILIDLSALTESSGERPIAALALAHLWAPKTSAHAGQSTHARTCMHARARSPS